MTFWKGDLPYATVCFWSTPLNYIVIWPLKCTQDALFKFQGNYEKTDQTTRIPMLVSVPLLYRDETAAAHSNYDRPQMMLMLRDGYFPFKLIWLQLKCVLQPWTGLADVSCTYAASSDPPTCTWRAWTVKESVKIPLLLGFITYKTNQLILRCHRADFSLVERNGLYSEKKSGREPCVAPAQRQPRSGTQTDMQLCLMSHKREKLLPLKLELLQVSRISG